MKKITLLLISFLLIGSIATAETKLTIMNSSSKTGGFSQQSLAYYQDLIKKYDTVNLVNPGNKCVAMKSVLPKLEGPVLLGWGSDLEAKERQGGCGATLDVSKARIIRFEEKPQIVCQLNTKLEFTKDSGRVALNIANEKLTSKTVNAVNKTWNTKHKTIAYDGWGNGKVALMNGEVDYLYVSPPGDRQVQDEGGLCKYDLSQGGDKSLFNLGNQNIDLVSSNIDVWLAWNMTEEQANELQQTLKQIHYDCDTAISKWQKGCDSKGTAVQKSEFDIDKNHLTRWEQSVKLNTVK